MPDTSQRPNQATRLATLLRDELSPTRRTRVVDVGANPLTPPPYQPLLDADGCDVLGFEPHPEAFAELQDNASDRETYYPFAVGDGSDQTLNIYAESGLTSVYPPYEGAFTFLGRSRRNMALRETVPLQTKRLDDIEDFPEFDLLKIDIQGGEVAVFQGGEARLASATVVITEVRFYPIYEDEPMLGGLDIELRRQGFELHKFLFEKEKVIPNSQIDRLKRVHHRNQLIDGDAVYIRDLGKLETYSDEDLKHLAITAALVFESHDLALFCLDRLIERDAAPSSLPARYVDLLPKELTKG